MLGTTLVHYPGTTLVHQPRVPPSLHAPPRGLTVPRAVTVQAFSGELRRTIGVGYPRIWYI